MWRIISCSIPIGKGANVIRAIRFKPFFFLFVYMMLQDPTIADLRLT